MKRVILICAAISGLYAATLNVPAEYSTIQAAIDAAVNGDIVLVATGTFTGEGNVDLDPVGKAITIKSVNGPENTTIDCENNDRAISFYGEETWDTVFEGFKIKQGLKGIGGAIYIEESSPQILNCIIESCSANDGGAIYIDYESNPLIRDCYIHNNSANDDGGAIYISDSYVQIVNCDISGNTASNTGGAISSSDSDLSIDGSTFITNEASYGGGFYFDGYSENGIDINNSYIGDSFANFSGQGNGGGMYLKGYYWEPLLINMDSTTVEANTSECYGGGIFAQYISDESYWFNLTISSNSITSLCEGGGMYLQNSDPRIINSVFEGNIVYSTGAAIAVEEDSQVLLERVLIRDNHAEDGGVISSGLGANIDLLNVAMVDNSSSAIRVFGSFPQNDAANINIGFSTIAENSTGEEVYIESAANLTIISSIVRNSSDETESAIKISEETGDPVVVTIGYSNVKGGADSAVDGTDNTTVDWGEGNYDVDPLFDFPEDEDYYLSDNSPCIGRGSFYGIEWGNDLYVDLDGNPRPNPDGSYPDMGAYENALGEPYIPIYYGPDWYVTSEGSDETGNGSEIYPFATIQHALNTVNEEDTVFVDAGEYVENITWPATSGIKLIGEDRETTIIDGGANGSVIKFESSEINETTILSGFTLQNGLAYLGGGIYLNNSSSPTLENLIISDNNASYGGGIRTEAGSDNALIKSVIISNNTASYHGGGCNFFSSVILENVLITGNTAVSGGGIIFSSIGTQSILEHVTIVDNTATSNGGGVYGYAVGNETIINSIIWGNSGSSPNILVSAGLSVFYSNIGGGWLGEGNINNDPNFTDPENDDYNLQPGSSCINAGTALFVWEGDTLVDLDEDEYIGEAPDMGAYESIFVFEVAINVAYNINWNLVSLPLFVNNSNYLNLFPDAITNTLFYYDGSYQAAEELIAGIGYWLRFPEAGGQQITGYSFTTVDINVVEGWNLISGPSEDADISDDSEIVIENTLYGYNGSYYNAQRLEAGKSYWLRAREDGPIIISTSTVPRQSTSQISTINADEITFSNASGFKSILYAGVQLTDDEMMEYGLPPVPPIGGFDVRFTGDMRLAENGGEILVQNELWPLIVSLEQGEGNRELVAGDWCLVDEVNGKEYALIESGTIKITEPTERLTLFRNTLTPERFALYQNYPNPFNPTTTIQFSLETYGNASLQIFDITGRLVETLVTGRLVSGPHTVVWDAKNVASGVYIYKLSTSQRTLTKKLIVLK